MKHPTFPPLGRLALGALLCGYLAARSGEAQAQAVLKQPVINGTNVTLEWSSRIPTGALQIAPAADGPWTTISDGSVFVSNRVVTPLGLPARFFRVQNNGVPGPSSPILPQGLPESPQILSATIQRLATPIPDGNTRLNVRFAPGSVPITFSNVVPVLLENRVVLMRDDGGGLDIERNDGVFSGPIDVDVTELEAANARLATLPASRRFTQQFIDRRRVGSNVVLTPFPITNFNRGQVVQLVGTNFLGPLKFNCPAGNPLATDWRKTMMITDLGVVADSTRTHEPCPWPAGTGVGLGKWTFGRLMTDICNQPETGIRPGVFAREWLRSWEVPQTINSFVVPAVPNIKTKIVNAWEAQSLANGFPPGELDLSIAPFRLCAIVNRLDLRPNPGFSYGGPTSDCNAGEARFVFCAVTPDANCQNLPDPRLLVIFEYGVPICGCGNIKSWAMQWEALNGLNAATVPTYNDALEAITDQFAGPNRNPSRLPNKSAINQIRSNEILGNQWVMREWKVTSLAGISPGFLEEVTVKNTPDISFDNTAMINAFLPAGSAPPVVPKLFGGGPFLAGSAPMPLGFIWDGNPTMGVNPKLPPAFDVSIRHAFALNTCNGCHLAETKTTLGGFIPADFTHVDCRPHPNANPPFQTAKLSDFLTGANMPKRDPLDPATTFTFADLERRVADMDELIHCPCNPFGLVFTKLGFARAKFVH